MRRLLLLAALLVALPAAGVDIEWVRVGDPGNAPDTASNCFAANCGSVPYPYSISKYEVTNAQYAEFLNAVATSDPLALYDTSMGSDATFGGITHSGSDGSYSYAAKVGFEDKPVVYVSFWDALRFANWLHNGQAGSDTEAGAYTITADGIANNTVTRNEQATIFLPSENEWFKAAYYSPGATYFDFPTGTDAQTGCVAPASDTGNSANCADPVGALTVVGAYGLSASPYGTFDQGGNVWEWNEQIVTGSIRSRRGGSWYGDAGELAASYPAGSDPTIEDFRVGFRVASLVPIGPAGLDAFLCYQAKPPKGGPAFASPTVQLADAFGTRAARVVKPRALCNPADHAGAGIGDPESHLASFGIAPDPKPAKATGVAVTNALGALTLDTTKLDRLLVPAAKSLDAPVEPLASTLVDHFACYKAKVSKGTSKLPKGTQASVADQFDEARTLDLKKPTRLCLPVDKDGEGVQRPDDALVCYQAKPAKGQAKHARRTGVHVNHQFGPAQLDTIKEEELCLPSSVSLAE